MVGNWRVNSACPPSLALGILGGGIIVGNAMPHLVNGLGGLDWRAVIYATSVLTLVGGLVVEQ